MCVASVSGSPPGRMLEINSSDNLVYVTAVDSKEIEMKNELEKRCGGSEYISISTESISTTFALTLSEFNRLGKPNIGDIIMIKMQVLNEGV